jgi:glycosyltransferase involved in cell wall biosynthesis
VKLPLVSVVMPTFNSDRFIAEAIYSLIGQTYPRFELIVVDGGSTDKTVEIVESYIGGDEDNLKVIKLSREEGSMPKSLNRGLKEAQGDFIARMDADDVAMPTRLAEQVHFFATQPEISLIGTGADLFWDNSGACRNPPWHPEIEDAYLINNPFFHPTIMFRRELYDNGIYYYREDQPCEEDYELWGRLIGQVVCANLDKSLLRYRIHGQNAQWDPRRHAAKTEALTAFCRDYGINNPALVDALVEIQCSGFLRYEGYKVLLDYGRQVEVHRAEELAEEARMGPAQLAAKRKLRKKRLPRLGWIHDALVRQKSYADFQAWYRSSRGWSA